jgi:Zn-dependent metalloprotease
LPRLPYCIYIFLKLRGDYWMLKKRKPIVALTLSLALILVSSPAVLANETGTSEPTKLNDEPMPEIKNEEPVKGAMDKDAAFKIAKELVSIPDDYTLESTHYNSSNQWEPYGSWRLEFVKRENKEWKGTISFTINAKTGELMGYNHWNPELSEPTFPPTVTREKAQAIAESFLTTVAPKKSKQVTLNSNNTNEKPIIDSRTNYYFQFVRAHEGIQFPQHYLMVEVNTEGKVINFYSNWDEQVVFPKKQEIVTSEEALELFKQVGLSQLEPQYVSTWRQPDGQLFISYQWNQHYKNSVAFIDAVTGKALNSQLEEISKGNDNFEPASKEKLDPHFTNEINEKEALDHIVKLAKIDLSTFKVESSSYTSNEDNRTTWRFSFQPKDTVEGDYKWINVELDAVTGSILNYSYEDSSHYRQSPSDDLEVNFTEEELVEKAKEVYKLFTPDKAHEIYYVKSNNTNNEKERLTHLNFNHRVNDIVSTSSYVSIGLDKTTGEVVQFYLHIPTNLEYPETTNLISKEEALELLLEQYETSLQYQTLERYQLMEKGMKDEKAEIRLVYHLRPPVLDEPVFLNAQTGEWHSQQSGEIIQLNRLAPTDIDDHWAKDSLKLMFDYRALDTDENGHILPNTKIKRGEIVKMIILSLNQGHFYGYYGSERLASFADITHASPYFQYVEAAVDMNLIEKKDSADFNPDETLTREELAILIVKALGYDKLAKHKALFQLNVTDLDQIEHKGHVAIANYLGILTAQNNRFLPQEEVTRATAATAFYRFLEKRGQFVEPPKHYYH